MMTTAPPPAERRCGSAARMSSAACPAFSANVAVKSPGPELARFPPMVPPALATRRSSPPSAAATSSTARPSAGVSVTSAAAVVMGTPCLASRAAAEARPSAPRAMSPAAAPSAASASAMARPMPRLPPVMSARAPRRPRSIASTLPGLAARNPARPLACRQSPSPRRLGTSDLAAVEAVPCERLHQLGLLVGEMGEQGVGEDVHRPLEPGEVRGVAQMIDQCLVDVVQHLMDDLVLVGQPVDHRAEARFACAQMREDRLVFEHVVPPHEPAVGGAVRAEGPIVLPDCHLTDRGPCAARVGGALADLADEIADAGQLSPQMVMDLDEVSADSASVIGIDRAGGGLRPGGPGGFVPRGLRAQPLAHVRGRREAQIARRGRAAGARMAPVVGHGALPVSGVIEQSTIA